VAPLALPAAFRPAREREATPIRIALLTPYSGTNLGDAAIQEAATRNIGARCPGAVISGSTLNPVTTAARHGIPCFPGGGSVEFFLEPPAGAGPCRFVGAEASWARVTTLESELVGVAPVGTILRGHTVCTSRLGPALRSDAHRERLSLRSASRPDRRGRWRAARRRVGWAVGPSVRAFQMGLPQPRRRGGVCRAERWSGCPEAPAESVAGAARPALRPIARIAIRSKTLLRDMSFTRTMPACPISRSSATPNGRAERRSRVGVKRVGESDRLWASPALAVQGSGCARPLHE
jgi:hypothetical protein